MSGREVTGALLERLKRRTTRGVVTPQQRALVLAMRGEHQSAAQLLLAHLPMPLSGTGSQEAEHRRQATLAAAYLGKAGRTEAARRLSALLRSGAPSLDAPEQTDPAEARGPLHKHPSLDALGPLGPVVAPDSRNPTLAPKQPSPSADVGPTLLAKVPEELVGAAAPLPASSPAGSRITPQLMQELSELRTTPKTNRPSQTIGGPGAVYPYELGTRIADRFVLVARVGHGGMAAVYRARDTELEEEVALKVFVQPLGGTEADREGLRRFRQELKLSRQLAHRHVIRVHDIGVHEARRYITMELLRGTSLYDLMGAPVDPGLAVCLLMQACEGVQAAHEQGVIHRDLKPENLFVTAEGVVKVMDFGIAKSAHIRGPTLHGTTAGTPEYMSPEQISDFSAVGPAADQYSLGVVAYELLSGRLPFESPELMKLFYMHLERPPEPLRELRPTLPAALEALVERMLAKDPAQRYPDLNAVLAELARLEQGA